MTTTSTTAYLDARRGNERTTEGSAWRYCRTTMATLAERTTEDA